jgi:type IV pilus assembly protein PilC
MSAQLYYYTARLQDGRGVAGVLRTDSQRDALIQLRARGLFVTSLGSAGGGRGWLGAMLAFRFSHRDATTRTMRSLAVLVGSGVPLRRSLECVIDQCRDAVLREALSAIAGELDSGASLSRSMRGRPTQFRDQVIALIAAGELGGTLDQALDRAADLLERNSALRRQLVAALAYPTIVLSAALSLVLFLLVATVPAFAGILTQMHAQLPLPTRALLTASELARLPAAWVAVLLVTIVATGLTWTIRNSSYAVGRLDRIVLKVPFFGPVQRAVNVAAFTRTLGTLLQSGVVITEAIRTTGNVTTNKAFRSAVVEMESRLCEGSTLAPLLAQSGLFDNTAVEMAYVGEESGALDAMLIRIAGYCEQEVDHALRVLTGVLEPTMIVVLGTIVGSIVAAILVPLYSAIGSLH